MNEPCRTPLPSPLLPGFNGDVIKEEKVLLAAFLDAAEDYLAGGYRKDREPWEYTGDPPVEELSAERARQVPAGLRGEPREAPTEFPVSPAGHRGGPRGTPPKLHVSPENTGADPEDSLEKIAGDIDRCTRCELCKTRTHTVPGEGVPHPLVMVVGEGPGAEEDASGRPFVGRAGQLLDRMLDSRGKIGLSRTSNCYIANIVKCRPPGNRNPQPGEITACTPFLIRQIKILMPSVILAAGNTAAKTLLDSTEGITRLRGIFTVFSGALFMDPPVRIPLLPTFHPSALLRDETLKVPVWEDLKTLRAKLCEVDQAYAAEMAKTPL